MLPYRPPLSDGFDIILHFGINVKNFFKYFFDESHIAPDKAYYMREQYIIGARERDPQLLTSHFSLLTYLCSAYPCGGRQIVAPTIGVDCLPHSPLRERRGWIASETSKTGVATNKDMRSINTVQLRVALTRSKL